MKATNNKNRPKTSIAIVGMGCIFPKSSDLQGYWRLLFHGEDAITDVPSSHWSPHDYYDNDPKKPDHVYCKRGGFISPVSFDPTEFGIPPNLLEATDTAQLLGMVAAQKALEDAGYGESEAFDRERTSVILGVTGTQELVIPLGARLGHPIWRKALESSGIDSEKTAEVINKISDSYVSWQENSFPGLLGNVIAGRICNRLDFGGTNCAVDAACASSLSAVHLAVLELLSGRSDMVITGGVDMLNDIFMHMCFSKTGVLSPTGDIRPFSKDADGTVLGEGVGLFVLKRLEDARRDGNKIYAVIKGMGSSSDGKSQSIYAPRAEGQLKALKKAYKDAGIDPATVGLFEAHGTGTRVGDAVEFQALNRLLENADKNKNSCALGSVKSMIGHTKAAAGAAGLMKIVLALHHKVLPPTLKIDQPDPNLKIHESPLYLNTETRPWFSSKDHPRRSGVSAFGFGGSNFHLVLEEYRPDKEVVSWDGAVEIAALSAPDAQGLVEHLNSLKAVITSAASFQEISIKAAQTRSDFSPTDPCRLLVVLERSMDLARLFDRVTHALELNGTTSSWHEKNIYYGCSDKSGKLAFVFPGQGSQYVGMGRDLVCNFPEAFKILENVNNKFESSSYVTNFIYPPPALTPRENKKQQERLRATDIAQPAIGAVSIAMQQVLQGFGVQPDATCGHSFGEFSALCAAGWIDLDTFLHLAVTRGRLMATAGQTNGAMLAVKAPLNELADMINKSDLDVVLANRNSPQQGVLSGSIEEISRAEKICKQQGFKSILLPVSAAFHSPLIKDAQKPFHQTLKTIDIKPSDVPVFSNTTGTPYSHDPEEVKKLLGEHLLCPVDFLSEIENLYASGVRTYIEVGPKSVLTGLVKAILKDRDFEALALDDSAGRRFGLADLAATLSHIASLGHRVDLSKWQEAHTQTRKQLMSIPIAGVNYRPPTPPELQSSRPAASADQKRTDSGNKNTMKNTQQQEKFILDALKVVQEGLKSMQALQAQTAETHQMFLQTQSEAGRTLQNMMDNTQRLAEASLGLKTTVDPSNFKSDRSLNQFEPEEQIAQIQATHKTLYDQALQPAAAESETASTLIREPDLTIDKKTPLPSGSSQKELGNSMLEVVSQLTGYPVEMLDLNMDIEADLGIDSIKRVEILSTLEEKVPGLPPVSPEIMGSLKTLGQIIDYLTEDIDNDTLSHVQIADEQSLDIEHQTLENSMLEVVSQLTGYPAEMLDLNMDIEADLGIDSIKRVEILSTLEEKVPGLPPVSPEVMGSLKTLGQIIAYLADADADKTDAAENETATDSHALSKPDIVESTAPAGITNKDLSDVSPKNLAAGIERKVVAVVEKPFNPGDRLALPPGRKVFVTDDKTGLAKAIADEFASNNIDTVLIPVDSLPEILNGHNAVSKAAGLVIVADNVLNHGSRLDQQGPKFLKDAFLLTNYLAPDLIDSAAKAGAFLATITRLDGAFGFKGRGFADPLQGGLAGLAKTASIEWDGVCCRAFDIAPQWEANKEMARAVVSELIHADLSESVEIGLDSDSRNILKLEAAPHPQGEIDLNAGDVVVVTGGARGVTAAASAALAKHVKPTLVLLGRSPSPSPEPEWLLALEEEAEIKKAILENEYSGTTATPMQIEKAFKKHMANREITQNLEQIKKAGAAVLYYSADVRNFDAISAILDEVRSTHGPIKGIIHGAGALQDRLIIDKTIKQFENVFDPKVLGLNVLLEATKQDALRYLVLFSSVAARMGNNGQVDYAMANEILNKIAQQESLKRPDCKVVSINWGPWDGGMVCAALKRKFTQSGIELIPLNAGAMCMLYEMQGDNNSPAEVVIGANIISPRANNRYETTCLTPRLSPVEPSDEKLSLTLKREIDLDRYPILEAHILDGKPVVPFALITEWLGHGALHDNPGLLLHGLDDMRIFQGIKLNGNKKLIRLLSGKPRKKDSIYEVNVEIRDGLKDGIDIIHSGATAILADTLEAPPVFNISEDIASKPYAKSMDEIYEKILFHGSALRGLQEIMGYSSRGMVARVSAAPSPAKWMKEPLRTKWIGDPLILDSAFQMAIVWCFEEKSAVSLPSYSASYRQYRTVFPADGVIAVLEVKEASSSKMKGDFTFLDSDGVVVAQLTGYEAVMNASLSRAFNKARAA